jgi:hypothetical protein
MQADIHRQDVRDNWHGGFGPGVAEKGAANNGNLASDLPARRLPAFVAMIGVYGE